MARIADCPLGRTVDTVGGWWALEVLHEVFEGQVRVETVARMLGISHDVAVERLVALVGAGLLHRDADGNHQPTAAGLALRPLLLVMVAWGNRDLAPHQRSVVLVDPKTGLQIDPVLVDRTTGRPIGADRCILAAGPAASAAIQERYPDAARIRSGH
jgi:DNA-binding HxlR family transcriptional regulator